MIYNLSKKKCISRNPVFATSFFGRCRGMIGRDFKGFDAMVFNRCNAIHTMFMSIPLDVIFLNRENRVCAIYPNVKPWRPALRAGDAYAVVELPAGTLEQSETKAGDILDLNAEVTREMEEVFNDSKKLINSMGTVIPFEESKR